MKKNILFIALVLIIVSSAGSQTKFSLNIYGGYTIPVADMQGDFPDTSNTGLLNFNKSSTLLTKSGFNIGVSGKYVIDTLGKAKVIGGLNINSLKGSKDYSRPTGILSYKNSVTIFTISAGFEYNFFPKKKFNPFAGLELAGNFYSGKIVASGESNQTFQRKSEARFGVIAGGGIVISMSPKIGIVIGVKYALTNLIGKKSEIVTTSTGTAVSETEDPGSGTLIELPLNDETNSTVKGKSLNYVQIYTGISFNLGAAVK